MRSKTNACLTGTCLLLLSMSLWLHSKLRETDCHSPHISTFDNNDIVDANTSSTLRELNPSADQNRLHSDSELHEMKASKFAGIYVPTLLDEDMVSQVSVIKEDLFKYHVCMFENVCIQPKRTIMYTKTPQAAKLLNKKYAGCFKKRSNLTELDERFCRCFGPEAFMKFLPFNQRELPEINKTPTYLVYQWLPHHHLSHFAFSTVQMHSVLQNDAFYSLPRFETILFQDIPPDGFTEYEESLWNIIKAGGKLDSVKKIEFLRNSDAEVRNETVSQCFATIYTSNQPENYAHRRKDLDVFKKSAEKVLGLDITTRECPPSRVLLLVRNAVNNTRQRKMSNRWNVLKLLENKGLTQIDILDLNGTLTLQEQASFISRYGLIISSHSSQLTNLLFAHKNAAVMEVSIVFKPAFRQLGLMSRTHYVISVGHKPEKVGYNYRKFYPRIMNECNFTRMAMGDVKHCPMTFKEVEAMKNSDYRVHLDYFEKDLDRALAHLESKCVRQAGWVL
ncbi:hypothetical protein BC830DRAFT_1108139 [Chytriomyces sp. MP71]|nr:hypothetical protein BC830DRAFT_1108139 [Chytriomyces sp. MP71]